MAELVTLESLLSADPVATDNSPPAETSPGATSDAGPTTGSPAGDLSRRITDLEALVHRHREQLSGSSQENARKDARIAQLEQELARRAAPAALDTAASAKRISLTEATQKFLLDNDASLLEAYEAQSEAGKGLSSAEMQRLLDERDQKQQVRTKAQEDRNLLLATLSSRHPEMGNMDRHPAFVSALSTRYSEMRQDPLAPVLFPPDPAFDFFDQATGATWDLRMILHAADQVKARGGLPPPPTLGARAGSTPASSKKTPSVPQAYVQGPDAVFEDPQMQRYLASRKWGNTKGQQVQSMFKHLPESTRQKLERGEI